MNTLKEVLDEMMTQVDPDECREVVAEVLKQAENPPEYLTMGFSFQDQEGKVNKYEPEPGKIETRIFTAKFHHGFGTGIRNGYSLWADESKPLRQNIWDSMTEEEQAYYNNYWANTSGETYQGENMHADDASAIIMSRLWELLKMKYAP